MFVHGTKLSTGTYHPGNVKYLTADDHTVLMVYGIPLHCTREDIEHDPRYAAKLKAIDRLVEIMNNHAEELKDLY